ncbi:MAG: calcium/sodium antiporter [Candidatus Woesebacteria bacterium]|jgi:cation:H+ antiporter
MPLYFLLFFLGLVGLWFGSELIIRGAIKISRQLGLSETFVGLTILAIGTDFPEIMVSLTGAIERNQGIETSGIIVGNVIGSNMGQIALVMGIAGLFRVLKMKKEKVLYNGLVLILSTFIFFVLALDGEISKTDGFIFLVLYLFYFITLKKQSSLEKIKLKIKREKSKSFLPLLQLAVGLVIIAESSQLVIEKGIEIASLLGLSQYVIGVVLVGIGTSLPEMVVSISAVLKKADGLSMGNLIGSNIVDILVALGSGAVISGWNVDRRAVTFDLPFLLLTVVVVVLFMFTRERLERKESLLLLSLYGIYITLKLNGW